MVNSYKRGLVVYIRRMIDCIEKIKLYTKSIDRIEDLQNDTKTLEACVFNIIQLGEITMQIKDHYPNDELTFEREIKGMRNFLVHSYHKVEIRFVFDVIKKHIFVLEDTLKERLKSI